MHLRVSHASSDSSVNLGARTDGKFLQADGVRFLVKGVTYGTFAPAPGGHQFPDRARVAQDFQLMAAHGINTVRTYTLPPPFLLDEASLHGLRVMAGVPWSQHVAFLADRGTRRAVERGIVRNLRELGDHPALLLVALGNEIPPGIVRWHGRRQVERFLENMYDAAKSILPGTLFTYVNFPPTEFLDLSCFDVASFNVYLHQEADLRAYVTRLQHVAGNRPLLLTELGADSQRQGAAGQAELTSMQLRTAFRAGACGAVAFAWTDEWWRGGFAVEDWDFGLVDRDRQPKPALAAVERVFADAPFSDAERAAWPRVSVVVCAYNAASTIDECVRSLERLNYPDFEVIVVNDGSQDDTGARARQSPLARVIDIENRGLSAARNVGLEQATGEIVAYTDADVRVDRDWLTFLVQPFLHSDVVGSGGPNVVPPDDPWMAQCVARAPGGPTHVLLDDITAEHVPGCNMAFRREALIAIGGFNSIYRRAGDDVDVCWRLQARGWRLGFSPAALVWHRHRGTVGAYWRQQVGYGEGEEWLAPHHPDRFCKGHAVWQGRIYSPLPFVRSLSRAVVNSGTWGLAPFPSVYQRDAYPVAFMPHDVRWLASALLLIMTGCGLAWAGRGPEGLVAGSCGVAGLCITCIRDLVFALRSDLRQVRPVPGRSLRTSRVIHRLTIGGLHFVQPLAVAWGRVRGWFGGVEPATAAPIVPSTYRPTPSSVRDTVALLGGRAIERTYWGERWTEPESWLTGVLERMRQMRVGRAIDVDDGWQESRDLSVRIGRSAWLDLRGLIEDHGSGKRLARLGIRLRLTWFGWLCGGLAAALPLVYLALDRQVQWPAAVIAITSLAVLARWSWALGAALAATERAARIASRDLGLRQVNPAPRAWDGRERRRYPRSASQTT